MITINTADAAGGNVSDTTQSYGVGKTAGGVKIGAYSIFADVANVTADGVKSDVISGTVDSPSGRKPLPVSSKRQHGNDDRGRFRHHCAAAFHDRSISAENLPAIQNTAALAITDDTNTDGQATITVKYL